MDERSEEGRAAGEHDPRQPGRSAERAVVRWGLPETDASPALMGGRGAGTARPARRGTAFAVRVLSLGRRARGPRLSLVAPGSDQVVDPETAATRHAEGHEAR